MESRSAGRGLTPNPTDSVIRFFLLLLLVGLAAVAAAPHLLPALTWVMALLSLLILGDLLLSAVRKGIARRR